MAGLLVSVRSAEEARAAVAGGAAVIDVKEPARGPLGLASLHVWAEVRAVVPAAIPVSVALGELAEWDETGLDATAWSGLAYRKIGLAGAGRDWVERWDDLRRRLPGPPWVAVVYADWAVANAPNPDEVLAAALDRPECVGMLVDTWDKTRPGGLDASWAPFIARAKGSGRLVALAGRLDGDTIARLAPLGPDLFAVRGAACFGGDRLGTIDARCVAELARRAASA